MNNESSQGLNFTANYKNARILAGKLMRDPKVTRAQKIGIFKEMLCVAQFSEKYTTLNSTPYPADVYMNHGIATERASVNGWDALEQESFHFAVELFRRFWESDAALKAQLPDAAPLFQAVAYKSLINTSVTEGLKYRTTNKSDMYRPSIYAIDVLRPYFAPGGKACTAINALQ
ncbi:MAG: hypothetical protein EOP07_26010 [Proteobacteria bacterium]|nr:MAG: hypothetical protein EOP07_26010 [Pseudomonadota bacterium]